MATTRAKVKELMKSLGVKPRRGTVISCRNCGECFYATPCHSKKVFCGRACCTAWAKKRSFRFPCVICGTQVFTQPAQIKYRSRKTCSVACRSKLMRKLAEARRTGYTQHQLDRIARYSPEAEAWRKGVFARDDFTCQFCKKRGGYIEADHIKPWAFFPELRFELSNGRTLCRPCHDRTKISAKRMKEIYGQKEADSQQA